MITYRTSNKHYSRSSDLAPPDYHLFVSIGHTLFEQSALINTKTLKKLLDVLFAGKIGR